MKLRRRTRTDCGRVDRNGASQAQSNEDHRPYVLAKRSTITSWSTVSNAAERSSRPSNSWTIYVERYKIIKTPMNSNKFTELQSKNSDLKIKNVKSLGFIKWAWLHGINHITKNHLPSWKPSCIMKQICRPTLQLLPSEIGGSYKFVAWTSYC